MHPSELGNMNGALNANINAVLAHIRNGNTNGPVGGLAGLAVADTAYFEAERTVNEGTLAGLLEDNGYESVQDYYDALDADPAMARNAEIDDAIAALGSDPVLEEPYEFTPPTDEELAEAEAALPELAEAQAAAENNMLSLWNKNGDANPDELTPEEEALLDDLRGRLVGYETDIEQAVIDRESGVISEDPELEEDEAFCEDIDGCEAPEDGEDLAAVE
jgi:sugar phosphate isomerase/epimerase